MAVEVLEGGALSPAWERRRRLIRRDIEEIGLELMAQWGYEGVSIEQLAGAAGISTRTFFRYFPSKEDLVLAMPLRVAQAMCDAVAARPGDELLLDSWRAVAQEGNSWDAIDVRSALLFRQMLARSPSVSESFARHQTLLVPFVSVIAARLGLDPEDLRAVVYASAIQGAMHASIVRWAGDREDALSAGFVEALDLLSEIATVRRLPARQSRRSRGAASPRSV